MERTRSNSFFVLSYPKGSAIFQAPFHLGEMSALFFLRILISLLTNGRVFLMINWEHLQEAYDKILAELMNAGQLDQKKRVDLQKKSTRYASLLDLHNQMQELSKQLEQSKKQAETEQDEELKAMFAEEIAEFEVSYTSIEKQLEELLYPADGRDERSAFLEIRAGAGGQEAALFAADLFKMYANYALSKRWKMSLIEESSTDIGGFSRVVAHITGKNVFRFLKFESGVHRVQRVPKTETAGRVHTSTVTVAVLPEAEDVEFDIQQKDLRIDVYRSSGAGGQHVNTTDSAVRITHIPTGVVVTCQDERSQIKNKAKAMKALKSRLVEAEQERKDAERSAQRKQQVGSGDRSEKIRTYNYPQNRVTDHRIGLALMKLDMVMQGYMDDLLEPLLDWDREERRKKGSDLENI